MTDNCKNLNVNLSNPIRENKVSTSERIYYINIFCPRCGKFNVRRHRIIKRKFSCDACGYRWKR